MEEIKITVRTVIEIIFLGNNINERGNNNTFNRGGNNIFQSGNNTTFNQGGNIINRRGNNNTSTNYGRN